MEEDWNPFVPEEDEGRAEETKRTARILDIIQNIAIAPGRWSRKALAERYEVSERQIQRDLEVIRHGLKLDLRRTATGYRFGSLPRLPTVSYSVTEALALLLAAQAGRHFGVDSEELASAVGRLESVFPEEFRPLLRMLALWQPPFVRARAASQPLLAINRAIGRRRKLRIWYRAPGAASVPTERVVQPCSLLPYGRAWYLLAYCELRQDFRLFKVDRMEKVEELDEGFSVPADFNLERVAGSAWGLMWGAAGPAKKVELLFDAEAGHWAAEDAWHPSQKVYRQPDGSYLITFEVGITPEFVRWLLFFGDRVRVLAPEELRQKVAEEHKRAWEANSRAASGAMAGAPPVNKDRG